MKESGSSKEKTRYQFESFCKTVLRNEARNSYAENERIKKHELLKRIEDTLCSSNSTKELSRIEKEILAIKEK